MLLSPGKKSLSRGVKFTFFGEVSLVKFTLQGLKSTLLCSLQPVDMKINRLTDFKIAQFRGKTGDLATLSGGDGLPVREWSSTRPRSGSPTVWQTHLGQEDDTENDSTFTGNRQRDTECWRMYECIE